jgi:N-formylglutamate amidohydrolase
MTRSEMAPQALIDRLGTVNPHLPVFVTIPHAGEWVPESAGWLETADPEVLLTDVDRFVDRLYLPALETLPLPGVVTRVHRYVVDLNRVPSDIDCDSVEGAPLASGTHSAGVHWVRTTRGVPLLKSPLKRAHHDQLIRDYFDPFHAEIARLMLELTQGKGPSPKHPLFHLDLHSMPSRAEAGAHADAPGSARPEVVVSDQDGKSCAPEFRGALVDALRREGFEVSVNWPYKGGRITQRYGKPEQGHHTIQIELNRGLYMDERTREPLPEWGGISPRLARVLADLVDSIAK